MLLITVIANDRELLRDILRISYLQFFSPVHRRELQGRFEEVKTSNQSLGCILVWQGALGVTNLNVSMFHACGIVVVLWMFGFQPH